MSVAPASCTSHRFLVGHLAAGVDDTGHLGTPDALVHERALFVRSRLGGACPRVSPIVESEVAARAILQAARHPRKDSGGEIAFTRRDRWRRARRVG
jgi:hypothetical protein